MHSNKLTRDMIIENLHALYPREYFIKYLTLHCTLNGFTIGRRRRGNTTSLTIDALYFLQFEDVGIISYSDICTSNIIVTINDWKKLVPFNYKHEAINCNANALGNINKSLNIILDDRK